MNRKYTAFTALLFAAAIDAADPAVGAGSAAPVEPDAAPAPPKSEKPAREKQNGVSRPSAGTLTGKVWDIADAISAKNQRPALRKEVTEAGEAAGINPATVTTQFGQWRRFYNLKKEEKVTGAETPKQTEKRLAKEAKAAAKAAKASATTDAQIEAGHDAAAAAIEAANAEEAAAEAGAVVEG